jgi:predicted RNase H-like nuclease (RuvC/YqgF family)
MKNFLKNLVIVTVLVISAYSIYQFRFARREAAAQMAAPMGALMGTAAGSRSVMQELEHERSMRLELSEENLMLKDYLRASKRRLSKLFSEFRALEKEVVARDERLNVMKAQMSELEREKQTLVQENEAMKFRLGSIPELKKAIREVKIKVRDAARELRAKLRIDDAIWGNAGFLVKDGQNTYKPAGVNIEVTPASNRLK